MKRLRGYHIPWRRLRQRSLARTERWIDENLAEQLVPIDMGVYPRYGEWWPPLPERPLRRPLGRVTAAPVRSLLKRRKVAPL